MRKKVLSLVFAFCLSLGTYAQKTEIVAEYEDVVVEQYLNKCNLNNRANPHTYMLLKFTNLTNKPIEFIYSIRGFYGEEYVTMPAEKGDKPFPYYSVIIPANETVEMDCYNQDKILIENGNPSTELKLTQFRLDRLKK